MGCLHRWHNLHLFLKVLRIFESTSVRTSRLRAGTYLREVFKPFVLLQAALVLQTRGKNFAKSIEVVRVQDLEYLF
jgi:hypothetical protein